MTLRDLLKYGAIGFCTQVLLIAPFGLMGVGKVSETIYGPWFLLGEFVFPSGPGGHALRVGAMLGWLLGIIMYSLLIAIATPRIKNGGDRIKPDQRR